MQGAIKAGPALGLDLLLKRGLDLLLAARPQFQGDAFGGPVAKAPADIGAADDEILTIVTAATDQNMDMRIVGVPMINRDLIEPCPEVGFHLPREVSRESWKIGHLGGVFG